MTALKEFVKAAETSINTPLCDIETFFRQRARLRIALAKIKAEKPVVWMCPGVPYPGYCSREFQASQSRRDADCSHVIPLIQGLEVDDGKT